MKKKENDLIKMVERVLQSSPTKLCEAAAEMFIKNRKFDQEKISSIIAKGFEKCLAQKLKDVSGYFNSNYQTSYEKYFTENLTISYDKIIKKHLETNKDINKRIDKIIENYLLEMSFEKSVIEFLNAKKELMMEVMLKKIFQDTK